MKKVYTKEETELFLMERNKQRFLDKEEKKNRPKLVHLSQKMIYAKDPNGKDLHFLVKAFKTGRTFVGSIRKQFTGEKRCNITNQL